MSFLAKRTFMYFLAKRFAFAEKVHRRTHTLHGLSSSIYRKHRSSLLPIFISKVTRSACLHSSGSGTDLKDTKNRNFLHSSVITAEAETEMFSNKQEKYNVNKSAENEERQIEMDPLSNNSLVSQERHQTWQPTLDGLNAGFDGNVANEGHQAGAEITGPQQREIPIPEPSFQLDQSQSTQTMDGQDETFKNGMQVAFWATSISFSGVTAVFTQFLVNKPNTPKCKFFAKASLLSMSATFMSGLFILILTFIRPKLEANPIIIKILMFGAIGSTTLVAGFGVAFYLEKFG